MKKTYVVGISGASGSGKSTISDKLKELLSDYRVAVISMDSYYRAEAQRPRVKGITDGRVYVDDNHPEALDFERCFRDIQKAGNGNCDILLIEGIFAFWEPDIFNMLDLKIYVDCDSDERLARRIARHLSFGEKLEEITDRYVQAVQPRQKEFVEAAKWKADFILNGFSCPDTGMEMVVSWIRTRFTE